MKTILNVATACLLFLMSSVFAQQTSDTAIKIAQFTMQSQGEQIKVMLSALQPQLVTRMRATGATENAAKVFADAFGQTFNTANITQVFAVGLSTALNEAELNETLTFLQSSTGRKYMALSQSNAAMNSAVQVFLKQACRSSELKLTGTDRESLRGACSQ